MKHENIQKLTLDNGVRLLMLPSDHGRSASVSLWIGSGSRFELPERQGVSHYIEHMLFKGTHRRSARELAEESDAIGGQLNAYTTKEYTCVYTRALDSHLPRALDLITDMTTNPRLAESDFEVEKGVILEEIGMYEDSPEDLMIDGLYSTMWQDSMLGANILGTRQTIADMTTDKLRAHMAEQYTGSRIVCAVSGAFNPDAVTAQVRDALGGLPRGDVPMVAQPAAYHKGIRLIEKDFEQTHISIGFPGVAYNDPRRHALGVLNSICGGSSSSRLFQRIREELGLAYSVGCSSAPYMAEGMFEVDAAVSPKNEEAAVSELVKQLCLLRRDGVTEQEFTRAKEQLKASIVMGLEGNSAISAHMGRGELLHGRIKSEDDILAAIDAVTVEQVNLAAREFIDFDNYSFCATGKIRNDGVYDSLVQNAVF
ncbi:MAG: insulinase family protein [Ruminococcaceae bacterium]|nr:insulinase family protein [Oscillospiraceae bacterium]